MALNSLTVLPLCCYTFLHPKLSTLVTGKLAWRSLEQTLTCITYRDKHLFTAFFVFAFPLLHTLGLYFYPFCYRVAWGGFNWDFSACWVQPCAVAVFVQGSVKAEVVLESWSHSDMGQVALYKRPHCCSLFVGLPDLQTELAGALFPLVIDKSIEWSLNPVNVLLREIFCEILV